MVEGLGSTTTTTPPHHMWWRRWRVAAVGGCLIAAGAGDEPLALALQPVMAFAAPVRLIAAAAAALLMLGVQTAGPNPDRAAAYGPVPNPRRPVGVCWRIHERNADAVVVDSSGDPEFDEDAMMIFADGRYPGVGHIPKYRWRSAYVTRAGAPYPQMQPDCGRLPAWPSQNLRGQKLQTRWNVRMTYGWSTR